MNKFSNFKIKVIDKSSDTNQDTNTTSFKINLKTKHNIIQDNIEKNTHQYKVNDRVKHKEEGITGKVNFVGKDTICIIWDDNTRERFAINNLNNLAYIDNVEEMVSPLTNQSNETNKLVKKINTTEDNSSNIDNVNLEDLNNSVIENKHSNEQNKSELDKLFEQAFDEMEDTYDDIEDANPNKLKNQKLQRKIDTLEKKIEDDKIANVKESAINDIIQLMKSKGMIKDSEGEKIQRDNLLKMDDTGFEAFKTAILSMDNKKNIVEPTEAELMLQRIKSGGPIIGDFGGSSDLSADFNDSPTRDLQSLASSNTRDINSLINNQSIDNQFKPQSSNLNFDGFKNLKGLTKPIQVIAEQKTPSQSIAEAMSSLDWTILTKV